MKLLSAFKRLDSRGASHLLLPLVVVVGLAVGGTYMLVASHANPATNLAAAKTAAKRTPKTYGGIVIFDGGGIAEKVKVSQSGSNGSGQKFSCSGVSAKGSTKKFNSKGAVNLACNPTSNTAKYIISYSNLSGGFNAPIAVDVDNHYCTIVTPEAGVTAKVPENAKGSCGDIPQNFSKQDVSVRLLLNAPKAGAKNVSGFAEVSPGGRPVNKRWCSGSVSLAFIDSAGATVPGNSSFPLRYVAGKDAKGSHNGVSYCVAKFTSAGRGKLKPGQTYTVTATYSGGAYMNPAGSSSTVSLPAAATHKTSTVRANSNGGVSAN